MEAASCVAAEPEAMPKPGVAGVRVPAAEDARKPEGEGVAGEGVGGAQDEGAADGGAPAGSGVAGAAAAVAVAAPDSISF